MKINKYIALLLLAAIATPFHAQATLSSLSGSNTPSHVQINTSGSSVITWTAKREIVRPDTYSVASTDGSFRSIAGAILYRTSGTLSDTIRAATTGTATFVMSESLLIPLSVIRTVQQQGDSSFYYQRTFTDKYDATQKTATVQFSIQSTESSSTSSTATASTTTPSSSSSSTNTSPITEPRSLLTITNIRLLFDDRRTSAIIKAGTDMHADAVINYNGSGIISYTWELASPPSTQGTPVFLPIESRRQHLMAGGRVSINSPLLPSLRSGEYLLRLKINLPTPIHLTDSLRYAVRADSRGSRPDDTAIITTEHPPKDARITPATEFQWRDIPGARAYQLEIYDSPQLHSQAAASNSATPVTGVVIPASKNRLSLNAASWSHLISGQRYFWRVIALAADGRIIGRSPLQEIRLP